MLGGLLAALVGLVLLATVLSERRAARDRPDALPRDGILLMAGGGGNYVASFEGVDLDRVRGGEVHARFSKLRAEPEPGHAPGRWPPEWSLLQASLAPGGLKLRVTRLFSGTQLLVSMGHCGEVRSTVEITSDLDTIAPIPDGSGRMLGLLRKQRDGLADQWYSVVVVVSREGTHATELDMEPVLSRGGLAVSPSGERIAVSAEDGRLEIRDLASGAVEKIGTGHAVAWSQEGSRLAYIDGKQLRLRDLASGETRVLLEHPTRDGGTFFSGPSFSSDGAFVAYSHGFPGLGHGCELVELETGRRFRPTRRTGTCGPFLPPAWMAARAGRCDDPVTRLE